MPQVTNPEVAKVFLMADRGMQLQKAFDKVRPNVTWKNVRRQYNARTAAAAPEPELQPSGGGRKRSAPPEPTPSKRPSIAEGKRSHMPTGAHAYRCTCL